MSEAIYAETALAAGSLLLGAFLMALYDALRMFRVLIPHGVWWTGLEDILYWLFSGWTTFLLLFYQNDGILRWYAVCGVLLGMLFYQWTISRILSRVLKKTEKYFTIKRKRRMRVRKLRQENRRRKGGEQKDDGQETEVRKRTGKKKEKRKSE